MRKRSLQGTGPMLPGMTMSVPLVEKTLPTSISCAEDSHAKILALLGRVRDSLAHGLDCGQSTSGSFARYDHGSSLWRTWQRSLVGDLDAYSETWPRAGMMRGGIAYLQVPVAPLTDETGSLSWPTPQAHDASGKPGRGCRDRGGHRSDLRVTLEVYGIMGAMNPSWVEQLMGFPEDWTDAGPQGPDKNSTRGSSRARSRKSRTGKAG